MQKIGFVSKDERLKAELKRWLGDVFGEFQIVTIGPPPTGDPPPAAADPPDENAPITNPEALPPLKLVIYDAAHGFPYENKWNLSRFRDEFRLTEVPWIAIGHEDLAHDPHAAIINGCNDLVLVPLDRLVLLQKVEYVIAAGAAVTPSFLYLAKTEFPVEMGKAVKLTQISETGCKIMAAKPLAPGVAGTIVSDIFGEGDFSRVEVRAVESTPHFEYSAAGARTAYEVNLQFFGLRETQLKTLRARLPKPARSRTAPAERKQTIATHPQKLSVALISHDPSLTSVVRSSIGELTPLEVIEYRGLKNYQATLMIETEKQRMLATDATPPSMLLWHQDFIGAKRLEDLVPPLPHPEMAVYYRVGEGIVERLHPKLKPNEHFLGASEEQWLADGARIHKGLSTNDQDVFNETLTWISESNNTDQSSQTKPELTGLYDASAASRPKLHYRMSLEEAKNQTKGALVKITVALAPETVAGEASTGSANQIVEAVIVDASVLYVDLKEKVLRLQDWLTTYNVKNTFGNRPPIIVINGQEKKMTAEDLRGTKVRQLILNFMDRRYHAELFYSLSRQEFWTKPPEPPAVLKADIPAFLMRPGVAEAISETGLVVTEKVPMKVGTDLLIMSPTLPNAPKGVWARIRSVTDKGEGAFANEFTFFGISDLMQKEIRRFTREDYVRKKSKGA